MTPSTCKNCGNTFQGNYCNNCGQSSQTHSINWHYIWHDIQHGIFHVDKGILFTAKELFTRPGASIREFIDGKRVKHFKPVAMVFLLATIVGFLNHYLNINEIYTAMQPTDDKALKMGVNSGSVNDWISSHYAFVTLLGIPLYAIASKIAFWRSGYNFLEHFILNSFIGGQKLIIQLFMIPLLYYCKIKGYGFAGLAFFMLVDIVATIVTYVSFFKEYSLKARIFRALLSYIILFLIYVIIIVIGIICWILFVYDGKGIPQ